MEDMERLKLAFELATNNWRIPPLLDAQDFIDGKVDELSIVLYVSFFSESFTKPKINKTKEKRRTARG